MSDNRVRDLERKFRLSGSSEDNLAWRDALKKSGGDAVFDLSLPHTWGVVQAADGDYSDYGSVKKSLSGVCYGDSGLHPFLGGVARPLTFKESIQARLDQLQVTGKFGCLWNSTLDTSSAIVYKANSTKFKIVTPFSAHLLGLPVNFKNSFLPVRYEGIRSKGVVELDRNDDGYNQMLTQEQVVSHKAWLAVFEGDQELLERYAEIVFGRLNGGGMGFWLVNSPKIDQLRALCAYDIESLYDCLGYNNFDVASFAWIRPL